MDAFTNTSSTRKFPCCAKLGQGKSHNQVLTHPIPLSKLNNLFLACTQYIFEMDMVNDFHTHFCNGVLIYGSALWAIRILSILLHCTNPRNLLKLHIAPMNPFYLSQISPNYATIDGFGYLWNVLNNHHPILHNVINSKGPLTTKG